MLTDYEQNWLLKCFPNTELSYETIVHNKVQNADYILAIPEGKKFFAWFTVFKKQNVCVLMEISSNKQICGLQIVQCCFHDSLAFGNIFYGTVFKYDYNRFFSIENLLYYKGKDYSSFSFEYKLETLVNIFTREIQQKAYTSYTLVFGLPVFNNSFSDLMKTIPLLPYKIKYLQFREKRRKQGNDCFNMAYSHSIPHTDYNFQRNHSLGNNYLREKVFQIKPDLQNDIYHLFVYSKTGDSKSNDDGYYDVAYIPDYKTSVMMNKLFRNIKENSNLDALEESDGEEEFEDIREDKFVYLERVYNMVCEYNYKFRKWAPVKVAQKNDKIVTRDEIKMIK